MQTLNDTAAFTSQGGSGLYFDRSAALGMFLSTVILNLRRIEGSLGGEVRPRRLKRERGDVSVC